MTARRSTTAIAVVVVVSLAAISAGSWGLSKWRPFDLNSDTVSWPQNVQPIVDYIEDVSDLRFQHSIDFEFIADIDEYNEKARDPESQLTPDDEADIAIDDAVGRALGFWAGDTSIAESSATVDRSTPRPVRWLPDEDLVLVHADDSRSPLSAGVRADLVVYLAQALIEQNFHLIERRRETEESQQNVALAALHIGYALWVHAQYVDDLSPADREDYEAASAAQNERYVDEVESVPATFRAIRIAFQVLGPTFVTALAEDDESLVIEALRARVPVALDQISLPAAKYLRNDGLETVSAPPGPRGAIVQYTDQLGPFRLYLMVATAMPANEALTAADGWGNDRFTVYELDDKVCADIHVVADSPDDADRIEVAMNQWAHSRPGDAAALVGREGVSVYGSVCDPGRDVQQPLPSDAAIEQYFARADLIREQALETGKPALAECVATQFFAEFTYDQFAIESMIGELDAAFTALGDECRNSV